jgi:hypothetical protein
LGRAALLWNASVGFGPRFSAARRLVPALAARHFDVPGDVLWPKPSDSFESWIQRLARLLPASMLLHEVTKVRNETVHEPAPAWPFEAHRSTRTETVSVDSFRSRGQAVQYLKELLIEVGMTVPEASGLLMPRLQKITGLGRKSLEPRAKEGLGRWLSRLLSKLPLDILVQAIQEVVGQYRSERI